MSRWGRVIGLACTAALAVPAAAQAESESATAVFQSQVAAALPSAQAQVAAAQASGQIGSLVAQVEQRVTPPTISQDALAEALYNAGSGTAQSALVAPPSSASSPPAQTAATSGLRTAHAPTATAASPCWYGAESDWSHTIAGGATVVWLKEINPQWCGNGSSITYGHDNWEHPNWSNYPYCLTSVNNEQGWDINPSWAHGRQAATTGIYSPAIICVPILGSEHVTVRVAASGYWDRYDDFGY
jgi:hypothetical protein